MNEPMTTLEVLRAGRGIIAVRERWTQGQYACNAAGDSVMGYHTGAVAFCSSGVLVHVQERVDLTGRCLSAKCVDALTKTLVLRGEDTNLMQFNDNSTHPMVIALWDETIQRLEQEV